VRRTVALAALLGMSTCAGAAVERAAPAPTSTTSTSSTSSTSTTTSTTSTTTTTTTVPRRVSTTTTTVAPTTAPTVAPIVTHLADVGILAPVAVRAPVSVDIPALEANGPVVAVGVNEADELDIPPDARTLVWYRHGPTPGASGSAVIAGHLNWKGVEGIFADLASTPLGEQVLVTYDDGSTQAFTVTAVELVEKPAIGVRGVFGRGGDSVLRLVTCGGEFDASRRSYRSNVVVTAVPTP
jgi:hypothetical protein